MNKVNLLLKRKKMKSRKPEFERQDANKYRTFKGRWRKPKGIQSKLRRGFKGHKNIPSIGYSSPSIVKGLTKKGFVPIVIYNLKDLEKVSKESAVIIAHTVGMKKKIQILEKAKENKINIVAIKDIDSFLAKAKEKMDMKKNKSDTKKQKKKKIEETNKLKETKSEDKKDESKK